MSSSLSKIIETGMNVFKSNPGIVKNEKYYLLMVGCNVWMSSFTFNWIIYDLSGKMQLRGGNMDATLLDLNRV